MRKFLSRLDCRSNMATKQAIDMRSCQGSTRFLLRRLEANDPTLIRWIVTRDFAPPKVNFGSLMEIIGRNHTLQKMDIHVGFVACLSLTQQHLFWNVIRQCPRLKIVSWSDFGETFPLSTSVLVSLLNQRQQQRTQQQQRGMVELELSHIRIQGDLDPLRKALQSHSSLRSIHLWDVQVYTSTRRNNGNHDEQLHQHQQQQDLLLSILLDLPQLQSLSLGCLEFNVEQMNCICQALSRPGHSLKSLRLRGGTPDHPGNNSRHHDDRPEQQQQQLQQLATPLSYESTVALANMLQVNQSLESLELFNLELVNRTNSPTTTTTTSSSGLVVLANALQRYNRTLKSFHLFQVNLFCRHDMTLEEHDALVAMLQENHVLESCLPNGAGESHQNGQIELMLKWNRCKLRGVQVDVNTSRSTLVETVLATTLNHDLDCIYHVLRGNTSLMLLA